MNDKPIFEETLGTWRVVALDAEEKGQAVIRFYRHEELFREIGYPAYRVWNVAAHLSDIIVDFEHGIAEASSFGIV